MTLSSKSILILDETKQNYNDFIDSCFQPKEGFRLTPKSDVSPYALCFAIFGKHLISQMDSLSSEIEFFDKLLRLNIDTYKGNCIKSGIKLFQDKGYLQLLCFTLSSLEILGTLKDSSLENHVSPLIEEENIAAILQYSEIYDGKPGTGNLAMFYAIFLIYSKKYLNREMDDFLSIWVKNHINSMNANGFWGENDRNLYLQFQNGYHQYEIFEYLGIELEEIDNKNILLKSLADSMGHFAPYPGGGGCYDYDATFLITFLGQNSKYNCEALLMQTLNSILSEQNDDGGFSESLYIRPRNIKNLKKMSFHLLEKRGRVRYERARFTLTLLRSKHKNIKTHWTHYSREWYESNLWDSWFRMLTIARIDSALSLTSVDWGFIDFPGIGYNHTLTRI